MSRYVDEGDILLMQKVDIGRMNNIDNLNKYMEIYQVKLLVYTAIKYLKNEILPFAQRKDDGKQYFYMHPKLVEVAQQNLIRHKQC
jgi:methionyl-tRNA formyltransferase